MGRRLSIYHPIFYLSSLHDLLPAWLLIYRPRKISDSAVTSGLSSPYVYRFIVPARFPISDTAWLPVYRPRMFTDLSSPHVYRFIVPARFPISVISAVYRPHSPHWNLKLACTVHSTSRQQHIRTFSSTSLCYWDNQSSLRSFTLERIVRLKGVMVAIIGHFVVCLLVIANYSDAYMRPFKTTLRSHHSVKIHQTARDRDWLSQEEKVQKLRSILSNHNELTIMPCCEWRFKLFSGIIYSPTRYFRLLIRLRWNVCSYGRGCRLWSHFYDR
jgi:predicted DNA-binding transcriptional regulator AlpA